MSKNPDFGSRETSQLLLRYGPGAYFAESSTKADEYAFDEPGGQLDLEATYTLHRV